MHQALIVLAGASLVIWLVLVLARGGFWRMRERIEGETPERGVWPAVVAVVPARDEAEVIARTVGSLVTQDYPGPFAVILVDDHSRDGTAADRARRGGSERTGRRASDRAAPGRCRRAGPASSGRSREGLREARRVAPEAAFIWFTDADIEHDAASLAPPRRQGGAGAARPRLAHGPPLLRRVLGSGC